MKLQAFFCKAFITISFILLLHASGAQQNNCVLKPPLLTIHFGQGPVQDINASPLANYDRVSNGCPTDGHYSFNSSTPGCFYGDWFALTEDHTPGDRNGNMMIVNAYPGGGEFLNHSIGGLRGGTTYELAAWVINICRLHVCCSDLSPTIHVLLHTRSGKKIAGFFMENLQQTETPRWKKYNALFTMPPGEKVLVLTMRDNAIGGCGNDFALDDITVRECIKPAALTQTKQPAAKQKISLPKQTIKKEPAAPSAKPIEKPAVVIKTKKDSAATGGVVLKQKSVFAPLPAVLRTRANPLIKQIETASGEIKIDLYDNGEIDGDTVTIYHNNELIVSHARLSQKPVSFSVQVDALNPHHELVMVADNLGSIPPNTSLMIVTAKDKKWQVFISSSEQKNAKLVINLQE
jgi:hypothetical protein